MKEKTRNLENLLGAAFRRQDCPAPEILQEILLTEINSEERTAVLVHVCGCGYCQSEIKTLAKISSIIIPAELLGYTNLADVEKSARKVIAALVPKELPTFPSLWQAAIVHGMESGGRMPLAAAAFSSPGSSRAFKIVQVALLLGDAPDAGRLDAVAKALRLTTKERATLAGEFIR